jgi:hypothetical protein
MLNTQPETELLLLCVSPLRTEARTAHIRQLLDRQPDWNRLESLADSHGLLPLLYWELKSATDTLPAALADKFQQNTQNSLFLTSELFRILDLFHSERIPAIPFKGPTLAASAYHNLALRSFNDLDMLIHTEDLWRARDLLLAAGYTTRLRLKPGRENAYTRSYDELVLYGPDEYPLIELHWAFVPPHFSVPLEISDVWKRTINVSLGNRTVPSLSPEDLFLVLCLHGGKHCWSHLGLVCDLAWLITTHSLSWSSLLARARALGAHRMVLLAPCLASQIFEVPLAEEVARDLDADPEIKRLSAQIIRAMFGVRHDETAILRTGLLHIRMRERWRDRLRYFIRLVTRPAIEDWQWVDLPGPLSFLYPVLRLPRLALKYWSRVS